MLKINNPEPKTATCNIKCWVVFVDGKLETPWPEVSKVSTIGKEYAYLGIYSYKYKSEAEKFENILKREGIEIREATIPKGSEYYEGSQGWSFPVSKEHMTITKFCSNNVCINENKK